jgi:hypothetical protein
MLLTKTNSKRFWATLEKTVFGREGVRTAIGRTREGCYLRIVYVPDPDPESVFVITAYELRGKPLSAYRRRHKRK